MQPSENRNPNKAQEAELEAADQNAPAVNPFLAPPQNFERKFLVGQIPGVLGLSNGVQVSHGYLAVETGGTEVRIRRTPTDANLLLKTMAGQIPIETEVPLSKEQLAKLWPLTEGRRVSKVTHHLSVADLPVTLDLFEGQLKWLRIAEIEFPNRATCEEFTPPPWFGREVTDIAAYRHSNLARE